MDLEQLEAFLYVAKMKSFENAAKVLHITQPAVSLRIAKLEKELKARLFIRERKSIKLTQIGVSLEPYAEKMLELKKSAKEYINQIIEKNDSCLEITTTTRIGTYILPILLEQFHELNPEVVIRVKIKDTTELIKEELLSGIANFALINSYLENVNFENIPLTSDPILLVSSPNNPLTKVIDTHSKISLQQLKDFTIINFNHNMTYYLPLLRLLNELNVFPESSIWVNNIEAMKEMTIRNLGISFLPKMVVQKELAEKKLIEIPFEEGHLLFRETVIVYNKKRFLSSTVNNFIDLCKKNFAISV